LTRLRPENMTMEQVIKISTKELSVTNKGINVKITTEMEASVKVATEMVLRSEHTIKLKTT